MRLLRKWEVDVCVNAAERVKDLILLASKDWYYFHYSNTFRNHTQPFKMLLLLFLLYLIRIVIYHGIAPYYLCVLITKNHDVRALHSNNVMLLDVKKIRGKTYGQRVLFMWLRMNGIRNHYLLEKEVILLLLNILI